MANNKHSEQEMRIVDSAIRIISREGIQEASFQKIADGCKMNQTSVLYYFPNKVKLIEAAVERVKIHNHEMVSASFDAHDNALERLLKHFRMNMEWGVNYPEEAQIIILLYYYASHNSHFSEHYKEVQKNAQNRIKEYLLAGIREKLFSPKLDVDDYCIRLHELLVGGFINTMTLPVAMRKKRMKELITSWNQTLPKFLSLK